MMMMMLQGLFHRIRSLVVVEDSYQSQLSKQHAKKGDFSSFTATDDEC